MPTKKEHAIVNTFRMQSDLQGIRWEVTWTDNLVQLFNWTPLGVFVTLRFYSTKGTTRVDTCVEARGGTSRRSWEVRDDLWGVARKISVLVDSVMAKAGING